jgi:hypothetical protein
VVFSSLIFVGFAVAVSTIATAFFLVFAATGLLAAVGFGSGFLGLAVLLEAVTFGCLGNLVTGWVEGISMWV